MVTGVDWTSGAVFVSTRHTVTSQARLIQMDKLAMRGVAKNTYGKVKSKPSQINLPSLACRMRSLVGSKRMEGVHRMVSIGALWLKLNMELFRASAMERLFGTGLTAKSITKTMKYHSY